MFAPGFIDIHNHSTTALITDPAAETQVAQGITTLVVGADGSSPWPIGKYLAERRRHPAAVNVMVMVGHATVRRAVMGDDYKRPARDEEIARMAALVDQGMREGAIGLSSGLEYEVGSYSDTKELIALAKVAARHGGFYMSHIRDEADRAFEAFQEAITIGEQAHVPVQISHIKLGTVGVWRRAAQAVKLIEDAQEARRRRDRGLLSVRRVAFDHYRPRAEQALRRSRQRRQGAGRRGRRGERHDRSATRRIPSTNSARSTRSRAKQAITPVELFIKIVKDGGASVIGKSMLDEDIRTFYEQPWVMVASDGGIGLRHPRSSGTFPRVLGRLRPRSAVADAAGGDSQDDVVAPADAAWPEGSRHDRGRRGRRPRPLRSGGRRRSVDLSGAGNAPRGNQEGVRVRHARVGRAMHPPSAHPGQAAPVIARSRAPLLLSPAAARATGRSTPRDCRRPSTTSAINAPENRRELERVTAVAGRDHEPAAAPDRDRSRSGRRRCRNTGRAGCQ